MPETPVLILAMKRTGSTSIMAFIEEYSSFASVEHEPFNPGRAWRYIYDNYQKTGELDTAKSLISLAVKERPNIKHCLDVVSPPFTQALVQVCIESGYRVFLLTRRDEASRLKSLVLALITKAWWKPEASRIYPGLIMEGRPLPAFDLDELRNIAASDKSSMETLLQYLQLSKTPYTRMFFEDFFGVDANTRESASNLLQSIGISSVAQSIRLGKLSPDWAQRSDDILPLISNYADICELLNEIAP